MIFIPHFFFFFFFFSFSLESSSFFLSLFLFFPCTFATHTNTEKEKKMAVDAFFRSKESEKEMLRKAFYQIRDTFLETIFGGPSSNSSCFVSLIQEYALPHLRNKKTPFSHVQDLTSLLNEMQELMRGLREDFEVGDLSAKMLLGSGGHSATPLQKIALFYGSFDIFELLIHLEDHVDRHTHCQEDDILCEEFNLAEWAVLCYHFRVVEAGSRDAQLASKIMRDNSLKNLRFLMIKRPGLFKELNPSDDTSSFYKLCLLGYHSLAEELVDKNLITLQSLNSRSRSFKNISLVSSMGRNTIIDPMDDSEDEDYDEYSHLFRASGCKTDVVTEFTPVECLMTGLSTSNVEGRSLLSKIIKHPLLDVTKHHFMRIMPASLVEEFLLLISRQDFSETVCWMRTNDHTNNDNSDIRLASIIAYCGENRSDGREMISKIFNVFEKKSWSFNSPPKKVIDISYHFVVNFNPQQWLPVLLLKHPQEFVARFHTWTHVKPFSQCQFLFNYNCMTVLSMICLLRDKVSLEKVFGMSSELFERGNPDDSIAQRLVHLEPELRSFFSFPKLLASNIDLEFRPVDFVLSGYIKSNFPALYPSRAVEIYMSDFQNKTIDKVVGEIYERLGPAKFKDQRGLITLIGKTSTPMTRMPKEKEAANSSSSSTLKERKKSETSMPDENIASPRKPDTAPLSALIPKATLSLSPVPKKIGNGIVKSKQNNKTSSTKKDIVIDSGVVVVVVVDKTSSILKK